MTSVTSTFPRSRGLAREGASEKYYRHRIGAMLNFSELRTCEVRRIFLPRLYEKSSNTGDPSRHEAVHRSVHQRFSARTQPLVVLAHPLVLVYSSDPPLHHPPPRQHHKAFRGHQLLPIRLRALLGPLPGLRHHYLFGAGFFGRSTRSTLQPNVFSTQFLPLSSPL
jgi:hypothetical protein